MSQGRLGYGRDEGHDPAHLHVGRHADRSVTALSAGPAPLMPRADRPQAVLVEQWCTLCLASAALSLALLALGRNEARTALRRLRVTIATSRADPH